MILERGVERSGGDYMWSKLVSKEKMEVKEKQKQKQGNKSTAEEEN